MTGLFLVVFLCLGSLIVYRWLYGNNPVDALLAAGGRVLEFADWRALRKRIERDLTREIARSPGPRRAKASALNDLLYELKSGASPVEVAATWREVQGIQRQVHIVDARAAGEGPGYSVRLVGKEEQALLSTLSDAAATLRADGRAEDADLVDGVEGRLDRLPVLAQKDARNAAQAIIDAYRHLDEISPDVSRARTADGTTPREDAETIISAALTALRAASIATQRDDVDALRALRRYSARWSDNDML